jgi:dTDP-glucose 4,6-dehydratase
MRALVTGGCGFIGSHIVRRLLATGWEVTNLDRLTYASNPRNLADVAGNDRYTFIQGDIADQALVAALVPGADLILNFAAETHVDRSLLDSAGFVHTDVEGVVSLLEAVRAAPRTAFVHMSTDEVFGSLPAPQRAAEDAPFNPSSPYSASKAAAELMIRAYTTSYGMPATILRCCNVYGPNQHIEKFIPLFTTRALAGQPLPLYGDGLQEREWLYVDDLVDAVERIIAALPAGPGVHAVHIGSDHRVANIEVARAICALADRPASLITPVTDRPGHDRRYALDSSRLRAMGWAPRVPFAEGLARTVAWYRDNPGTWGAAATDAFLAYFDQQYGPRLSR